MWYVYISIAVLFRGAICYPAKQIRYPAKQIRYPAKQIAEDSNCTVVITRFGEQLTTLEVKWNSDIHLICDASCVGSGSQPALTWFYRDKINQSKLVNIERLFRSQKFETYPTFHRRNELVIRKFGPNEETDFICYGSIKRQRQEAKVTLTGTDCLLKYNFRCKLDNKCIDRAYLCNQNNECPDGEDEVGCASVVTADPPAVCTVDQYKCASGECVDGRYRCDGKPDCSDGSDETNCLVTAAPPAVCTADQYKCASGECVDGRYKCDVKPDCSDGSDETNCQMPFICTKGRIACKDSSKCISISQVCNKIPDCTDGSDEKDCGLIVTVAPPAVCTADLYKCASGECVDGRYKCDGKPDCYDGSDEENCRMPFICTEGKKACKDASKCISDSQLCNKIPDCTDGSDEKDCGLTERPTVNVSPHKITIPIGNTANVHCIVTGVPAPTIIWFKSHQKLSTNHQTDGDVLRITQATMEDQGIYVCRAENIAGADQDWGIVEVKRRIKPKIDLYPERTHNVFVGSCAFFQCRVMDGDPPPKVTWSRVGGFQLTERTEVLDNGVIMFKGTTQQEQGSYICTATNDMGNTTVTATLIVQASCPPDNFQCKTTSTLECLDNSLVCDGSPDCTDQSDEARCKPLARYREDQFQCADGNCVEAKMKCDGTPQCEDGSDEQNCPTE